MEAAQEEAMRVLLEGLHFSPYALLLEVVENEFSEEVQEQEREAFCRRRGAGTGTRGVLPRDIPPSEKPVRRLSHIG